MAHVRRSKGQIGEIANRMRMIGTTCAHAMQVFELLLPKTNTNIISRPRLETGKILRLEGQTPNFALGPEPQNQEF